MSGLIRGSQEKQLPRHSEDGIFNALEALKRTLQSKTPASTKVIRGRYCFSNGNKIALFSV